MKKILIVVAHPDDEVLGCGGTVARMISEGHDAYTLILSEGATSRKNWTEAQSKELKKQIVDANKIMKVEETFVYDFPDNKFDSVPLLDIVKTVNHVREKVKPNVIFTHFRNDLNVDHRITYQAVLTATRPMQYESVKTVYSFEILSSTEWNFPLSFAPNVFFDISGTLCTKLKAMNIYKNEIRDGNHPRSRRGIITNAQYWGLKVGLEYAEAFEVVRNVK